jgi:cytochrome c-type biogenesis protein CcmH
VADRPSQDPELDARVQDIASELRCLVCQNESIAASRADLAKDLRAQVRTMLQQGATKEEILTYMTDRYGDFVRYSPPLRAETALLWGAPALLALGGAIALGTVLRRRQRLADEAFEASSGFDDDPMVAAPAAADAATPPRADSDSRSAAPTATPHPQDTPAGSRG